MFSNINNSDNKAILLKKKTVCRSRKILSVMICLHLTNNELILINQQQI